MRIKYENGCQVPQDYEGALAEYNELKTKDHVTGAYMRLFCDYGGIVLAILPIFLGVTRCLRDKRAKAAEVLYSKPVSAGTLIVTRYMAAVFMAFLPVLIMAFVEQLPVCAGAKGIGAVPDAFAFLKYCCGWLLPEIMAVTGVAFLITELTGTIVSIFVQVLWALASLMSAATLEGEFGLKLVARWNSTGGVSRFQEQFGQLCLNRGYYAVLSILCVAVTILFYEKKRGKGGNLIGSSLRKIRRTGR